MLIFDSTPEKDIKALENINNVLEGVLSIPYKAIAHYLKGSIFLRQNYPKKAVHEIELALRIDPKFGDNEMWTYSAWTELAFAYEDIGNISKSVETIQELIKIFPTYFNPENNKRILARSYLDLALIFVRHKKLKSSNEKFLYNVQQAIKLDSKYSESYYILGLYYCDEDLYHRAKENFERYLEFTPYETSENKEKIEYAKETLEDLNKIFE